MIPTEKRCGTCRHYTDSVPAVAQVGGQGVCDYPLPLPVIWTMAHVFPSSAFVVPEDATGCPVWEEAMAWDGRDG